MKSKKRVVTNLTLGIHRGECFGLLGPNGAGKTTSIRILLQATAATEGATGVMKGRGTIPETVVDENNNDAQSLNGPSKAPPTTRMSKLRAAISSWAAHDGIDAWYQASALSACGQKNAIWDDLTPVDHMKLFQRVRSCRFWAPHGKPSSLSQDAISWKLSAVGLDVADQHRPSGEFSGGMKRKLCAALALFTGGRIAFLDEPSTGVDPYARRHLWQALRRAQRNGVSIVFTTHTMSEADAVCDRIAIIHRGELQCLGTGQHLRERFGREWSVCVRLKPMVVPELEHSASLLDNHPHHGAAGAALPSSTVVDAPNLGTAPDSGVAERILEGIRQALIGSRGERNQDHSHRVVLREAQGLVYRFAVDRSAASLPELIRAVEGLHRDNQRTWDDVSVSDAASLDQIFLDFVTEQTPKEALTVPEL